jgi:DNA repair protein RecO (recombination protein O)
VYLLTAEQGIIRATVFGGPKSKLRAHAAPFNSGKVWLYHNPVKDSVKISDFDVHSWRPGLRELYARTMAAGAVTDTVLATHGGGGSWETALHLATTALDALENANEEMCSRVLVHFLWRWAGFLGLQPQVECCAACEKKAGALWFSPQEGGVFCDDCAPEQTSLIRLDLGCRRWLSAVGQLESSQLSRYSMDSKSFREVKSLVTTVLSAALGKRLSSWEW